jgi:hypothetical protein
VRLQIDFLGNVTVSHRGHRALSDDLIARGARLAVLDREQPGALARALDSGAAAVIDTIAHTADDADQLLKIEPSVGSFVVISSSIATRQAGRLMRLAGERFPTLLPKTRCSNAALRLHLQQRRHEAAAQRLRRTRCTGSAADPARRILRILIDGFLERHACRSRIGLRLRLRLRRSQYAWAIADGRDHKLVLLKLEADCFNLLRAYG